ncbi:hypothetical protein AB0H73_13030 [Streptomyces olivoreticuli]
MPTITLPGHTTLATIDMSWNSRDVAHTVALLLNDSDGKLYRADRVECLCCGDIFNSTDKRPAEMVRSLDHLIADLHLGWIDLDAADKPRIEREIYRAIQVAAERMFRAREITD